MRLTTMTFAASAIFSALVAAPAAAQVVDGSGTANVVPQWTDSNTLGVSNISIPVGVVTVTGKNGTVGTNGGTAPVALRVRGGSGASSGSIYSLQGAGGGLDLSSGNGAGLSLVAPYGGGKGAAISLSGGGGAICFAASTRCAVKPGNGGSIWLQPGAGGSGGTLGHFGNVLLAGSGGNVGIGLGNPSQTLEVRIGGTTLADDWTIRSSRRFKTNIQPLQGALGRIKALQGVSYERKSDGKREIGVVAEDVDRVIPEVVAHDPQTHEVEGVDYSRLVALLIEAVKSQQAEIERLKSQMAQLTANAAKH